LSGHEHNFQHSTFGGIDYLVTGAAGKFRDATPNRFEEAHTRSWSNRCHFLLAEIDGDRMTIRAIGERAAGSPALNDIERWDPTGAAVGGPIVIS
jgi:hypothetical protein